MQQNYSWTIAYTEMSVDQFILRFRPGIQHLVLLFPLTFPEAWGKDTLFNRFLNKVWRTRLLSKLRALHYCMCCTNCCYQKTAYIWKCAKKKHSVQCTVLFFIFLFFFCMLAYQSFQLKKISLAHLKGRCSPEFPRSGTYNKTSFSLQWNPHNKLTTLLMLKCVASTYPSLVTEGTVWQLFIKVHENLSQPQSGTAETTLILMKGIDFSREAFSDYTCRKSFD